MLPITFKAFDGIGDVGGLTWIANDTVLTISGDGELPDKQLLLGAVLPTR